MSPAEYLASIESTHRSGRASEHSYRPAFAALLESRGKEEVTALNDPKREKCGAPDYTVFRRRDRLTVGWAETKDFGISSSPIRSRTWRKPRNNSVRSACYRTRRTPPTRSSGTSRFLVILGNPPYAGHSANKGEWITSLIREYMHCDGKPLGEKNPKYLHDDYLKFIRWAQWRIEQTGQGVVGFITNHGYLNNPTFRGMRQSLIQRQTTR